MANPRRRNPKAGRHLTVVPDDDQATLWDPAELHRLSRLRKLAIETGVPPDGIRLIDQAGSADEAVASLTEAGFMPTEAESLDGMLAWFAPLLAPGCDQLEAEICGSGFIGQLRTATPAGVEVSAVLIDLISGFDRHHGSQEALAMMRVLAAVGPAGVRDPAAAAAGLMVGAGQTDPPWASELGRPRPGRCFGQTDIYGEQRSIVLTFSYGSKAHAIVILIDYLLGGGLKDCYLTDRPGALRAEYRQRGEDPELQFSEFTGAEARAIVIQATAQPLCPMEPGQAEHLEASADLLMARLDLLPQADRRSRRPGSGAADGNRQTVAAAAGAPATQPARRPAPARNVHRLKVAIRGAKPPSWRRIEVPSDLTLQRLHAVVQAAFGWPDGHVFAFETPAGRYGAADADTATRSAAARKLSAVADWPGDRIRYDYDCGAGSEHDIVVEAVLPATPGIAYPRCVAGRGGGGFDREAASRKLAPLAKVLLRP